MSRHQLSIWLSILLGLGLQACGQSSSPPIEKFIPVKVVTLQLHDNRHGLSYSATITPATQVNLAFKVNGYIESIYQTKAADGKTGPVTRGTPISKGTVLARVQQQQYKDKVKEAKANLASANAAWLKAKADNKRARILYQQQSMTAPDYDSARQEYGTAMANVAAAKAQLDDAQQNLAYCALQAPMDGVLLQRNIEVGSLVNPTNVAFVLADMKKVKVIFTVPDTMLKNISLGESLAITSHAKPEQIYIGIVTTISPSADQQTRVFEIEITLDNAKGELQDGMVTKLKVPHTAPAQSKQIFLPINAVVRSKDKPQGYAVYIVQKKQQLEYAQLKNVQLGEVHGNTIAVTSGLKVADRVIVSGVNTAWDGALIKVID